VSDAFSGSSVQHGFVAAINSVSELPLVYLFAATWAEVKNLAVELLGWQTWYACHEK
jgi:hypothetical protein